MNTILTTADVNDVLKEKLKGTYFDFNNTVYRDSLLKNDNGRSLSTFYRNGYIPDRFINDSGYKTLPITIHILGDKHDDRAELQRAVIELEREIRTYAIYNTPLEIKGVCVNITPVGNGVISLGYNDFNQIQYVIDFNIHY